MKQELLEVCDDLEHHIDEKMDNLVDRLSRVEEAMDERIQTLDSRYSDDDDIAELKQLNIGLRRTRRLLRGKLSALRGSHDDLMTELAPEIKDRVPAIKQTIERSESYEQASVKIQKEAHSASDSFKDFFKAILMWRETPEERLRREA